MIVWLGPPKSLGRAQSSVTQMKLWKCLTPLSWQNQFHMCGLHSCQWSVLRRAPIKKSSHLRKIFKALAPVFSNLPAVWKSFQAPLWKSERRRSSVSVKAICDGQIFRVWKGKSEKGVFTYANLTGWDWDSLPQWSHVKFLVHFLYIGGWSEVNNVIYAGNSPWIMWYLNTWSGGLLADVMKLIRFPFSDACDNIDTDFDVTVCFCKRWGIMCINKLLICWQLLQKRKSERAPILVFF